MNLNQLEYFVTVAETLNFTKAAEKCFVSQTAITQQIRALERTVGVPLFIRDKHHVELTTAGLVYLDSAREILEKSRSAIRLARTASKGVTGHIRIGFIRGYGHDLAQYLRRFHKAFPNVRTSLLCENSSVLFQSLEKGECDIIFSVVPYIRRYPQFEHRFLDSYPLMVVTSAHSNLSDRTDLTYSDLKDEKFILMQPASRERDEMEEAILVYDRGGFMPQIAGLEGNPETLLLMIATGMGISILPDYITRIYRPNADYVTLPLLKEDKSAETLDFEICWIKDNQNPALSHFLSEI